MFGLLLWVDWRLAEKGMPPMSAWWRWAVERFWQSAKDIFKGRVGRRGGKSSTLVRVAVTEALFRKRDLPPGEVGVWPYLSHSKNEAAQRLNQIEGTLRALGFSGDGKRDALEHHQWCRYTKDSVERIQILDTQGHTIEFWVVAATVAAASGFTAIGGSCDEVAKWRDEKSNKNPATEILRAVKPTIGTQPGAHIYIFSSPWGEDDAHSNAIAEGDTDLEHCAVLGAAFAPEDAAARRKLAALDRDGPAILEMIADVHADSRDIPSWVASPAMPIERGRLLEPDLYVWLREYGGRPMSRAGTRYFDGAVLDRAAKLRPPTPPPGAKVETCAAIDTGSTRNACALAIVKRWGDTIWPVYLREWIPSPGAPIDTDREFLPEAAKIARAHGCDGWEGDAYYLPSARLRGAEAGLATACDPCNGSRHEAAKAGIHRGYVVLAGCEGVDEAVRQLRQVRGVPGNGGTTKIVIPEEDALHGDLGVALVRALARAGAGDLGSPKLRRAPVDLLGGRSRTDIKSLDSRTRMRLG